MSDPKITATRRSGRMSIWLQPSKGQSPESVEADLDRSEELTAKLIDQGVQSWESRFRWIGPVKVMATKEVGPPPWRFPKLYGQAHRRPLTVSVGIGWRSTAYQFHAMWAPKHNGRSGES